MAESEENDDDDEDELLMDGKGVDNEIAEYDDDDNTVVGVVKEKINGAETAAAAMFDDETDRALPSPSMQQQKTDLPHLEMIQSLAAITGRGEFATKDQRAAAESILRSLEDANPTPNPTFAASKIQGRWELVYSTTQLFRSSPFFMAGRAVCKTQDEANRYNWFCDMHRKALAISSIGAVRQIVSQEKIVSEFEVTAGAIPFLSDFTPFRYSGGWPVTIDGAIVSTADIVSNTDGTAFELFMDTVEIKGSNIPGLRQLLDGGIKLQSRQLAGVLESAPIDYENPKPLFRTTYLDDLYRISRDQDGHAFMYVKTSSDPEPTDYSGVDSDLGIGRLIAGFNDAITNF